MVIHCIVTRLMHSNTAAYCTFSRSDILFYIFSKYMHWTHCTSKWFELWGRYRGSETSQTLKCIAKILRSIETIKELLDGGYNGHLVTFIMSTHWQQETLFMPCQTLSKVVICYYCHLCTKICDHTHTDTNYETGHIFHHSAFLLTDQHLTLDFVNTTAQCMCVCVCAHMQTSESDKRRLQADSWQSASTSFHVIQCKHCMKYENKISWAQAKSCPSYFRL